MACVSILLFLTALLMVFVQNYRAIKNIHSQGCQVTTEPGFLLGSLPKDWQQWLNETFEEDYLLPFVAVTGVEFSYLGPNTIDLDLTSLRTFDQLEVLDLRFTTVVDDDLNHLKGLLN